MPWPSRVPVSNCAAASRASSTSAISSPVCLTPARFIRFIFGFEESYGDPSDHVRDKDAVNASMLICQMAQYYKLQGKNLVQAMRALYEKHGFITTRPSR